MRKGHIVRSIVFGVITLFIFSLSGSALGEVAPIPPKDKFPDKNTFRPIVQKVIDDNQQLFLTRQEPYENPNGTWDFLEEVVKKLREVDQKFAFNGKRGNLDSPSHDVISYYWGPGTAPAPGSQDVFKVYVIDISSWGDPDAKWTDSTNYEGCTLGAYLYPRTGAQQPPKPDKPSGCPGGGDPGGGGGGGGGGGSGTGGGDDTIIRPALTPSGTDVMTGKNPSLTFDPVRLRWLVVAENGGAIKGQFVSERAKLDGSLLNIGGGNATMPRVAYGANKFLVVWTDKSGVLWGQLLASDSGASSGGAFRIGNTTPTKLYDTSVIQYDATNQRFVLAYENQLSILIATITPDGAVGVPIRTVPSLSVGGSDPSLAISSLDGSYCLGYRNAQDLIIRQPFSAAGAAAASSLVVQGAEAFLGIVHTKEGYVVAWIKGGVVYAKTLQSCANEADTEPAILASEVQKGVIAKNSSSYALFVLDFNDTSDRIITFDDSGNLLEPTQPGIVGTWTKDNKALGLAANAPDRTYGAVGSPDGKTVKILSGIGIRNGVADVPDRAKPQDVPVPDKGLPTDLGQLVQAIFSWSLSIIGLVVFVRFFYAGFLWFTAGGSPGQIGKAREIMWNAVYGIVILFSAYLLLNTINPDLVRGTFGLPAVPGAPGAGAGALCQNNAALAKQYNEPESPRNDPRLDTLLTCMKSKLAGVALGEESTIDKSNPQCNLTRGNAVCSSSCSHTVNSCHYGGKAGTGGSLAVDFGEERNGDKIIQAAIACGVPKEKARCESSSGNAVSCSDPTATHVHVSEASCDAN